MPHQPYFSTPARLAALRAAAARWRGTPFRENSAIPGPRGGVSCHNLVAAICIETGAVPPFAVPRGSARRLLHNPAGTILAFIDATFPGLFARVDVSGVPRARVPALVRPGDLLVMAEGRVSKHVGVALPGAQPGHSLRIAHVLLHTGCDLDTQLDDPTYLNRIIEVRRPLEVAKP